MNKFKFLWFVFATCVIGVFLLSGCTSSEQQSGERSNRSKREAPPTEPTQEAKRVAPATDDYKAPLALHQEATERETFRSQTARQEISQSDYTLQPVARQAIKTSYEREVYTCPMHSAVQSTQPGSCPTCGMALVNKSEQGATAACPHCSSGGSSSSSARGGGGCGGGCCK